jgi:hypothetical protein
MMAVIATQAGASQRSQGSVPLEFPAGSCFDAFLIGRIL